MPTEPVKSPRVYLQLSTSPHIRQHGEVPSVMLSVVGALAPACIGSVFFFGIKAALLIVSSVGAAAGAEWVVRKALKLQPSVGDFSAVVTGMLLALSLPPSLPPWMAAIGSVFAVIVVKMAFGGLGNNFMNPALAGRAFLVLSYPAAMTHWSAPLHGTMSGLIRGGVDAASGATPLAYFNAVAASGNFHPLDLQESLPNLFWGSTGGCIGETSTALLLVGALFLWYRRIIGFSIPIIFIGTFFLLSWMFNGTGYFFTSEAVIVPVYQILSGGLMLAALLMATDPATTPITIPGRLLFGFGCGLLTFILRKFGGSPEGVCFAILIMNCFSPIIDKNLKPKHYGERQRRERNY